MITPISAAKVLPAGTDHVVEYTPASGSEMEVIEFIADAAFTNLACVQLIWKYGTSDELVWSITGSSSMPQRFKPPTIEIDGVNKLALILKNDTAGQVSLSGYVEIETRDV